MRPHHSPSAERGQMVLRSHGGSIIEVLADLAAYADSKDILPIQDLATRADALHFQRVLDDSPLGRKYAAEMAAINASRRD